MIEFKSDVKFVFKVIVIGEPAVGKTSLIKNLIEDAMEVEYKPTIGTDLFHHYIETDKGKASLGIWDIAGQVKWHEYRHIYYTGARGGLVVYDRSRFKTFKALNNWFEDVRIFLPDIPIILVENKIDLESEREIDENDLKMLKEKYGFFEFFKASAKTSKNVKDIFQQLTNKLVNIQ